MSLFLAYLSIICSFLSGVLALLSANKHWLKIFMNRIHMYTSGTSVAMACLTEHTNQIQLHRIVFGLLILSGGSAIFGGLLALLSGQILVDQLPFGLPWMTWHIRLDSLSGFFLVVVGLGVLAASIYAPGYVREYNNDRHPFWLLGACTSFFIVGMEGVLLANDAFFFVIAWEIMSVSSYFLVAFQHDHAANRRAAFLYLLMAVIGGVSIILGFGVLAKFTHTFDFDSFRTTLLTPFWGTVAFLLGLLGFGMKAGLVPVHAWLPEAHPVAPSHISALMSGVMLKVAIYGLIRFSFDLLGDIHWQWGFLVLILGTLSAVSGILYALQQNHIKRLLAYSSIENIGVIAMGIGLSMIFLGKGHSELAVIGLLAALYHVLNHSVFKNLLFLIAGSILHQTHESNFEHMGGLIRRMPKTAVLALIGSVAISALPPLNGFVSEWLTFQAALQASSLESALLRSLIPVTAAVLAFTGATAAATFAKFYGIAFLGQPRSKHVAHAREVTSPGMLLGPAILAVLCILLGIFPTLVVRMIEPIAQLLVGRTLPSASEEGWLWLTPGASSVASYSALYVLLGLSLAGWAIQKFVRRISDSPVRRESPWDCGFGELDTTMQYTSTAFSQPFRRIFQPFFECDTHIENAKTSPMVAVHYQLTISDRSWKSLYLPIEHGIEALARWVAYLQAGNIRTYLAYSFLTLLLLLGVVSG